MAIKSERQTWVIMVLFLFTGLALKIYPGYYNEQDHFPVFTVERITMRENPIYHSTYTGKPPDEPVVLGVALNEVFVPLLQKQFPEITDFYLPPEGCSYRMAVVSMKKQYAGHAKRVQANVLGQCVVEEESVLEDEGHLAHQRVL